MNKIDHCHPKTIDGYHSHILGGSFISLGNCANVSARFGFRRHFYQVSV